MFFRIVTPLGVILTFTSVALLGISWLLVHYLEKLHEYPILN